MKDEFDAFLECGILAHGFLPLRCGDCGHDKLVTFSCKRRGFCPSCGARRMAQTAAHLVDHVNPLVPVRQWVLSLPIPLRLLVAAQPKLVTPVLQVVHRVITRFLLDQAGLKAEQADSGAVTLIQPSLWMKGSAANLNIHLHCLVLDGVYRCDTDAEPVFVEVPAPTDEALQTVLHKVITRLMNSPAFQHIRKQKNLWMQAAGNARKKARNLTLAVAWRRRSNQGCDPAGLRACRFAGLRVCGSEGLQACAPGGR